MRLLLATEHPELKDAFLDFNGELKAYGESSYREDVSAETFDAFLAKLKADEELDDPDSPYVPMSVYWLEVYDEIYGEIRLRHYLNENLEQEGGHIGYHVRPTKRGKGYATVMLRLLLKGLAGRFERVLVTCDTDNIASARVIAHNGGLLASQGISERSGKPISRYWIDVAPGELPQFEAPTMETWSYQCSKCGWKGYQIAEIRGSSGGLMAYMNVDDQKLTLVICRRCKYADVYAMPKNSFCIKHKIDM